MGQQPNETDQFELQVLATPLMGYVDVIAIHGLNGDRIRSWSSDTSVVWRRDLLPNDLRSARIMTFGYKCSHTSNLSGPAESSITDLYSFR